jgi:hypothetical protein
MDQLGCRPIDVTHSIASAVVMVSASRASMKVTKSDSRRAGAVVFVSQPLAHAHIALERGA